MIFLLETSSLYVRDPNFIADIINTLFFSFFHPKMSWLTNFNFHTYQIRTETLTFIQVYQMRTVTFQYDKILGRKQHLYI